MVSEMESVSKISTSNSVNNDSTVYEMDNHQSAPSAQDIGLEFVRQYYTVLNRAPQLLFRFYSDDSTYVHGYLDKDGQVVEYIKGQKQINAKIMSLNYGKCHTKIRQVDSMETNGNGVVIQVIGELSTNEQPSRRFLQTFVLTPQTPNKYYVRNDIFRYLDKYQDDDTCDDTCSKVENISQEDDSQVDNVPNVEKEIVYKTNGIGINDEFETVSKKVDPPTETIEDTETEQKVAIETSNDSELKDDEDESVAEDDTFEDISKGAVFQSSNEPKTYAGILGRSQGSNSKLLMISPEGNSNSSYMNESNANSNATSTVVVKPLFSGAAPASTVPSNQQPPRNEPYRFQKKTYNRRNDSKESAKNNDSDSGDGDHYNLRDKKYPDENQLFVGNLLPGFSEEIVHKIFGKYGKIVDVRINRQKIPGNKSRNYGFVTFEDPEVVNKIIAQKPIFHENHRYNVEKKQGKSNYERNRSSNMQLNPTTSVSSGNLRSVGGNVGAGGGQGSSSSNLGGSRNRGGGGGGGPNYNHSSNNINNPNRGPISNRNTFNQQQQQHNR